MSPLTATPWARRRLAVLTAAGLLLTAVPLLMGFASAADVAPEPIPVPANKCNGIKTTPGSDFTNKELTNESTLLRGGTASFLISYPTDSANVGKEFTIIDCLVREDTGAVLASMQFTFVPSNDNFSFPYVMDIPPSVPLGTRVCNYAKTVRSPSKPQESNRKAEACFTVGGALSVHKRDIVTKAFAPGAKFEVDCEPAGSEPTLVIGGLDTTAAGGTPVVASDGAATGFANSGIIAIEGPEDTACTVTELAPPAGYEAPSTTQYEYTIPRGKKTETILNTPQGEDPSYDDLVVTNSATGTYGIDWTLSKTADGGPTATRSGVAGGNAGTPVEWVVQATKTTTGLESMPVTGTAVVQNSNNIDVDASVSVTVGGTAVDVDCDGGTVGDQAEVTVPAATDDGVGEVECTYEGTAAEGADVVVTVESDTEGVTGDDVTSQVSPTTDDPDAITVSDSRPGSPLPATTDTGQTWEYTEQLTCPSDTALYQDGVLEVPVVNTASATGVRSADATVDLTCSLPPVRGLDVVKSVEASDDEVNPGDTLTYTLTATATGDQPETDVVVTDHVPGTGPEAGSTARTTYVAGSAVCDAGPCDVAVDSATGLITWGIGTLLPADGETPAQVRTVSFAVTVDRVPDGAPAGTVVVNVGAVESEETPQTPSNEVVTPVTDVRTSSQPPVSQPRQLPFADPEPQTPRVLPFTGTWVLPALSLGLGSALIGALLLGAARRRPQE